MKRGRGLIEGDMNGQVVDGFGRLDRMLSHRGRAREHRRIVLQHVEGEDHVIGVEGLAVAPFDTFTNVDRQFGEVIVVLIAGGQPGNLLIGEGRVEVERLPQRGAADLMGGAGGIGIAQTDFRDTVCRCRRNMRIRVFSRGTSATPPAAAGAAASPPAAGAAASPPPAGAPAPQAARTTPVVARPLNRRKSRRLSSCRLASFSVIRSSSDLVKWDTSYGKLRNRLTLCRGQANCTHLRWRRQWDQSGYLT